MGVSQREFADRDLKYTTEMMKDQDETHGDANRQVMQSGSPRAPPWQRPGGQGLCFILVRAAVRSWSASTILRPGQEPIRGISSDLQPGASRR